MNPQSAATPGMIGIASDRGGNGPIAAGLGAPPGGPSGGGSGAGPTGPGTQPDSPSAYGAGRSWTRSDDASRSEFSAFLDDLSALTRGQSQSDLHGEIERRVSQARHRMSNALDQGREMTVRARDQMNRGIEHSREAVSERPLSYLAMAMVGGLVIGLLISRRD
jgi:ElaB/YqjD/DUF883 family membrane-anchored ribosome-binding protein